MRNNPNSLVARLYKAKYYPINDFMVAPMANNSSFIWRSIHKARLVLEAGFCWVISDGVNISVFGESWTSDRKPVSALDSAHFNPFLRVFDLLISGDKFWNFDFIHHLFAPHVAGRIINTPFFSIVKANCPVWLPESSSIYSVHNAYRLFMERVLDTTHLQLEGNWHAPWKLKTPQGEALPSVSL